MVPIPKPLVIMPGNKPRFKKLRTNNESESYGKTQVMKKKFKKIA